MDFINAQTRSFNDSCSQEKRITESMGPGNYQLETQTEPNQPCNYSSNPNYRLTNTSNVPFQQSNIDVESELLNLNRYATDCPDLKYQMPNQLDDNNYNPCVDCLQPDHTSLTNPSCNLRGSGKGSSGERLNSEYVCPQMNPQNVSPVIPFRWNVDTVLNEKDNYKNNCSNNC